MNHQQRTLPATAQSTDTALHLALCHDCGCHRWVSGSDAVERWMHCHSHGGNS
jgi:hypothetical protein